MPSPDALLTLLYCPFPTLDSARAASEALLAQRLVACCNLLPGMESHYWWQGTLTQSTEVLLLAKTPPALAAAATQALLAQHPYETPAILQFSAESSTAFAAWIHAATNL